MLDAPADDDEEEEDELELMTEEDDVPVVAAVTTAPSGTFAGDKSFHPKVNSSLLSLK